MGPIEQAIINMASKDGLFALMFVFLLFYVLKQNNMREGKYQEVIKSLAEGVQKELVCINSKVNDAVESIKDFTGKKG